MTMQIAGLILNPNYGKPDDVLPLAQVRRDDPSVDQRLPSRGSKRSSGSS
jgi:hypothetical protein